TPAAWAAKRATSTIPIVATFVADPVGSALVSSLARPGGDITGLTTLASGLVAKRLELLKDLLSRFTMLGVFWQPGVFAGRTIQDMMEETKSAARALELQLQFAEIPRSDDLEPAFSAMKKAHVGGILIFPGAMFFESRRILMASAAKHRLPTMFPWRAAGGDGAALC